MTRTIHRAILSCAKPALDQMGGLEREAARLLARIVPRLEVEAVNRQGARLAFDAPAGLLDRLSAWGADREDIEDDAPLEDDEREER